MVGYTRDLAAVLKFAYSYHMNTDGLGGCKMVVGSFR